MVSQARLVLAAASVAALAGPARGAPPARPFEGFTALVVEPERSWGWDSAVIGALAERGFEVRYGALPESAHGLSGYDLVALSIKRNLSASEAELLSRYVEGGGVVYGSWGGPFGSAAFLRDVCRVAGWKSLRLMQMRLLEGPLSLGVADRAVAFAQHVGDTAAGEARWEIVSLQPAEGGIPVAEDDEGNALGVLAEHGRGRAAVLGFGPEKEKYFARPELGPIVFDNLLVWLLEGKPKAGGQAGSAWVEIALPARAEVLGVAVNDRPVGAPAIRTTGSVKRVRLDVSDCGANGTLAVRITYPPLARARHVETIIHLPWNTLRAAAQSPGDLAEYLRSLNATICQPLLRGQFGQAWYRGMPEDQPDGKLVTGYQGNFLADLIRECHARGLRLIGGLYLDNATPLRNYPDVKRLDRAGAEVKDPYNCANACLNDPRAQEHSLATVEHLLRTYDVDGLMLDDNFELDANDCYCSFCKEDFREYCHRKGIAYQDPAEAADEAVRRSWRDCRREATRRLVARVAALARERSVPVGGWVSVGMDATHLAAAFDFLGGMVYTESPRAVRGPLSVIGDRGFVSLLWAPDASPEGMEREAREAVRAGAPVVGFWIRGEDGGYRMDEARSEAIRRSFAGVEAEWLEFYRDNLVTGDRRFVLTWGKVGPEETRLTLKNTGQVAGSRIQGNLDLGALE